MRLILCFVLAAIATTSGAVTSAQRAKVREPEKRPQDSTQSPMECEGAAMRLDFAVIETKKIDGGHLIIIGRLGDGESSNRLNQTRLAGIEEYILRRAPLKYVLAQGARVKGLGRTEVYVGGRLTEVMPFKKNAKGYCIGGADG